MLADIGSCLTNLQEKVSQLQEGKIHQGSKSSVAFAACRQFLSALSEINDHVLLKLNGVVKDQVNKSSAFFSQHFLNNNRGAISQTDVLPRIRSILSELGDLAIEDD